jgi:hypothetical protein
MGSIESKLRVNRIGILCSYCVEADLWAWGQLGPPVSLGAVVHSTIEDPEAS